MNTAKNRTEIKGTGGEIILYRTKDGRTTMDVRLDKETVWLNLNQIAALFGRDKSVVSRHLSNIFGTKELNRESTVAFFATVRNEGGHDLYPSIEEKAAHLLYFVVKNHAFVDGNKRIGAFLFIWFLDANGLLYRKDGTKRLADNALVALTLLIAESKPAEKDTICKVIVNLINRENI